mgnify:CR=1 FL=1
MSDFNIYGDLSKEEILEKILEVSNADGNYLESSPIFQEGYENWDIDSPIKQWIHNKIGKSLAAAQAVSGKTLWGSALDPFNTISIEDQAPHYLSTAPESGSSKAWASIMGHEIPHLGWRYKNPLKAAWANTLGSEGTEEIWNRMHDKLYQPNSLLGIEADFYKSLRNKGFYETMKGAPYGWQYSPKGIETIRRSGLVDEHKKALGYYESPTQTTRYKSHGPSNVHTDPVAPRTSTFSNQTFDRPPSMYHKTPKQSMPPKGAAGFNRGGIVSLVV